MEAMAEVDASAAAAMSALDGNTATANAEVEGGAAAAMVEHWSWTAALRPELHGCIIVAAVKSGFDAGARRTAHISHIFGRSTRGCSRTHIMWAWTWAPRTAHIHMQPDSLVAAAVASSCSLTLLERILMWH